MSETAAGDVPVQEDPDKDIPAFLKKGRTKKALEPKEENLISADNTSTENAEMDNLNLGHGSSTRSVPMPNDANLTELAEMTIEQLKQQQAQIDKRIQEKQQAERKEVIAQIVKVVSEYDVPVEELVEALGGMKLKRKGTKAKAKYRDPATGTTWSGRGKEPAWIKGVSDRSPFEI